MKRKLVRLTLAVLLIGMVSLLSACGKSEPEQAVSEVVAPEAVATVEQAAAEEVFELPGDYAIDISNLGMALKFYLRIDEDNTFLLSANRAFSDNRGSGTIGELDGTYLMIYADSTPDKSKTATFERLGPNLIFRSVLPYGSANISFEKEDDENPEIIHHLVADKYVYEEYYDTYLGFETVDGVDYEYVLQLGAGAKYNFASNAAEAEVPTYQETGSFRVSDGTILITPQGEVELTGSIAADGALKLAMKAQKTAQRQAALFRVATTAEHAGIWQGQGAAGTNARLELDYFGEYAFASDSHAEAGIFAVTQQAITFTQESQDETTPGTKMGFTLEASFNGADWLFYDNAVLGEFSGGTMVNEAYLATLHMSVDGSYTLLIVDEENESAELVNEAGAFTITPGPMSYMLTLNSQDQTVRVGDI